MPFCFVSLMWFFIRQTRLGPLLLYWWLGYETKHWTFPCMAGLSIMSYFSANCLVLSHVQSQKSTPTKFLLLLRFGNVHRSNRGCLSCGFLTSEINACNCTHTLVHLEGVLHYQICVMFIMQQQYQFISSKTHDLSVNTKPCIVFLSDTLVQSEISLQRLDCREILNRLSSSPEESWWLCWSSDHQKFPPVQLN